MFEVLIAVMAVVIVLLTVFLVSASKKVKVLSRREQAARNQADIDRMRVEKFKSAIGEVLATTKKGYLKAGLKEAIRVTKNV